MLVDHACGHERMMGFYLVPERNRVICRARAAGELVPRLCERVPVWVGSARVHAAALVRASAIQLRAFEYAMFRALPARGGMRDCACLVTTPVPTTAC